TVELGHGDVQYDDVRPKLRRGFEQRPTIGHRPHHVALGLQQFDERFAQQPVVVDKQDARSFHTIGADGLSGMRTLTCVPSDGFEWMASSPPRENTRSRMLTSPSPPLPRFRSGSKPEPSSTIRSAIASADPLSSTRTCCAPLCLMEFASASCAMR